MSVNPAAATLAVDDDPRRYEHLSIIRLEDPDAITSVEIWASQAALDAHMEHGHTGEFLAAVADLTDGDPQMRLLEAKPAS